MSAEIVRLDERRSGNGHRLLVAVEDALFEFLPEPRFFDAKDVRVEYVAASSLTDPETDADLWIGRYMPSAPGRSLMFQTTSGATYETDGERRVWRRGQLVFPGTLIDFGVPGTNERGTLRTGHEAALLFVAPQELGWHVRVRVTTPVLLIAHLPPLDARAPIPRGWLSLARRQLTDQT